MAVGDVYRLAVLNRPVGQSYQLINIFHFEQRSAIVEATECEDLAVAWIGEAQEAYRACFANALQTYKLEVRGVTDPDQGFDLDLDPWNGLLTGQCMPLTFAPIVSWKTGLVGRSNRGRTYMPPPTEDYQDMGVLSSALVTLLTTFAGQARYLSGTTEYASWQMVVHSPTMSTNRWITTGVPKSIGATQRRRRQGTGS